MIGTGVYYQPGLLIGGNIEHECNTQRSIGYYLEGLLPLAPFCKTALKTTLRGVTNSQTDPSVSTGKINKGNVLGSTGIIVEL